MKAAVLPVPVWAWPATSRPASEMGRVSAWMGVQRVKPLSSNPWSREGCRSKSEKRVWVRKVGAGARWPDVCESTASVMRNRPVYGFALWAESYSLYVICPILQVGRGFGVFPDRHLVAAGQPPGAWPPGLAVV